MDRGLKHHGKKTPGLGNDDITKYKWITNQHRDSHSSYIGHFDMLNFIAVAENESKARVKYRKIKKMIQPCGPPPQLKYDESIIQNTKNGCSSQLPHMINFF